MWSSTVVSVADVFSPGRAQPSSFLQQSFLLLQVLSGWKSPLELPEFQRWLHWAVDTVFFFFSAISFNSCFILQTVPWGDAMSLCVSVRCPLTSQWVWISEICISARWHDWACGDAGTLGMMAVDFKEIENWKGDFPSGSVFTNRFSFVLSLAFKLEMEKRTNLVCEFHERDEPAPSGTTTLMWLKAKQQASRYLEWCHPSLLGKKGETNSIWYKGGTLKPNYLLHSCKSGGS